MGRKGRKNGSAADLLSTTAALLLTVVLSLPAWPLLARCTAVAATVAVLPEGGLYYLRQRFAPEVVPPDQPQQPAEQEQQTTAPPAMEDPPFQPEKEEEDEPVPEEFRGMLLHETFTAIDDGTWLDLGEGWLRNYTALGFEDIRQAVEETPLLQLQATEQPQVLILHTHATESYETHSGEYYDTRSSWRTQNEAENVCAIGAIVAEELEAAGIGVILDTTQHDHPGYNGSYDRSRSTAQAILDEHPTIQVILDIHRDAIQRDATTIVAPVTTIDGTPCAQVMIAAGCDDGMLNMPNWRQNLRFAVELQNRMEADWPTLTRPLFFAHRKYNQDMAPGALLIEMGASGNTFDEAAYAAQLTGKTLAKLLKEMEEQE